MGTANATGSFAVVGHATGGGNSTGVSGLATLGGKGVSGTGTGASSIGVDGISDGPNGKGVRGRASDAAGFGVFALIDPPGPGTAVYAENTSAAGWAGYFNGRFFSTSGFISSDAGLKKDIVDMRYGLAQVLALHPVTFRWKANDQPGVQLGLIAQEVDKLIPEIVDHGTGVSNSLSVNYTALLPVVIKGMQEQQKIILGLEARVAKLEQARRPSFASLVPGWAGPVLAGFALGIFPLGLLFARRRGRRSDL